MCIGVKQGYTVTSARYSIYSSRPRKGFTQVQPRDFPCMSIELLQSEILHYRVARLVPTSANICIIHQMFPLVRNLMLWMYRNVEFYFVVFDGTCTL